MTQGPLLKSLLVIINLFFISMQVETGREIYFVEFGVKSAMDNTRKIQRVLK